MKKTTWLAIAILSASALALGDEKAPPDVMADSQTVPLLPDNQELFTLKYKLKHPEATEDLARLIRSYTPPTSRIFPNTPETGVLQVTDTAKNLKEVYTLLRENDAKPTPQMRKKWRALQAKKDRLSSNPPNP